MLTAVPVSMITDVGAARGMSRTLALHAGDAIVAELQAADDSTYAEWIDGLRILVAPGGQLGMSSSATLVDRLARIGMNVRMLALSSDGVEVSAYVSAS